MTWLNFLNTIEEWFSQSGDIFVVARLSKMAGARMYSWFSTYPAFWSQVDKFPPQTQVIVFRERQFPLRGIVTPELISRALGVIPEHTEAMVTRGITPPDSLISLWACDTHAELLETLQDLVGVPVSIGLYVPWHRPDTENMISAIVPLPDGTIRRGIY